MKCIAFHFILLLCVLDLRNSVKEKIRQPRMAGVSVYTSRVYAVIERIGC